MAAAQPAPRLNSSRLIGNTGEPAHVGPMVDLGLIEPAQARALLTKEVVLSEPVGEGAVRYVPSRLAAGSSGAAS